MTYCLYYNDLSMPSYHCHLRHIHDIASVHRLLNLLKCRVYERKDALKEHDAVYSDTGNGYLHAKHCRVCDN